MKSQSLFCKVFLTFLTLVPLTSEGQVKITDGSVITMNPNSLLELESSNKGLLVPRIVINNLILPSPLSTPIPAGMLVFSSGGNVKDGFYYWNGTGWIKIISTGSSSFRTYTKSSNDTLLKENSIIFASNNITLILPQVSGADTGLQIIVKNTGIHTDKVVAKGYGSATIENQASVNILPELSNTFVARGANWILLDRNLASDDIINVGPGGPFQTLPDALDYLKVHMEKPITLRLSAEFINLSNTQIINLPYPLTIEGTSFGSATIAASDGLAGKPMFRCLTECYFKMLIFDAKTLTNYGISPNEDAIRLSGTGTYHEIKDCTFDRFYNAVVDSSDAELWLFECDISDAQNNGLLIHSAVPGVKVRISETDFIYCKNGVYFSKGSSAEIQLMSGVFTNNASDNGIVYNPSGFSFSSMIITNNSWNHIGNAIVGFDFTRTDGRDANAFIENNAGLGSSKPHCKINVVNNLLTVTCTTANTWYKANWTNTSTLTTNFSINNNRITYLPVTSRHMAIFISGNVLVNGSNRVITVGIVKNGNSSVRYGETTLRVTVANQPFQFSTVIYLEDVMQNDYYELFCSSANSGDILNFQDINWYVTSE